MKLFPGAHGTIYARVVIFLSEASEPADHGRCCTPQSLVTHGQCTRHTRPTVTFLASEYHCLSTIHRLW